MKITVAGLGPGDKNYMLPLVKMRWHWPMLLLGTIIIFNLEKSFLEKMQN